MKLETYAKQHGKKPFNWNKFLNQEEINENEWLNAESLAENWVTCACGNQCDVIPRDEYGMPLDYDLIHIGLLFYYDIQERNNKGAKIRLADIEKRSAQLIKEINQSKK